MNLIEADKSFGAELPTRSELACLRRGNFVKVALADGERFWAMLISNRRENGTYAGVVETKPVTAPSVKRGDAVVLEAKHVMEMI